MNHDTATLDEVRDEVARLQGWDNNVFMLNGDRQWKREVPLLADGRRGIPEMSDVHPVPPSLDAIAAMMPEGWFTSVEHFTSTPIRWLSSAVNGFSYGQSALGEGATELEARLRCLCKVLSHIAANRESRSQK